MEQEFESILEAYPVRLVNFEGPLDLLLHLIKRSELSIYDINIVTITRQYIEYIDLMQEMNLDVAGSSSWRRRSSTSSRGRCCRDPTRRRKIRRRIRARR